MRGILLVVLFAACATGGCGSAPAPSPTEVPTEEVKTDAGAVDLSRAARFARLHEAWQVERQRYSASSSTAAYWQGPNGRAIIAMGKEALPFLFEELKKGDHFYVWPIARITGVALPPGQGGGEQERRAQWLEWWKEHRDDPEWTADGR